MPQRDPKGGAGMNLEMRLADSPMDAGDGDALAVLRQTLSRLDPVPDDLVDRIQFAVAVTQMWTEVAEIQRAPVKAAAGVRSTGVATQTITFSMHQTTVMVVIGAGTGGGVRMDGWITPEDGYEVALRLPRETRQVVAIDGRFEFDGLAIGGLVQIVVHKPGTATEPVVVTPAFQL